MIGARGDLVEVVDRQNEIIQIQSGVIDELFRLLSQHLEAADIGALPVIAEINHAAQIRAEID